MKFALLMIVFFCLLSSVVPAHGQDEEALFRKAVLKQQLFLRDFNAEDTIQGQWVDGKVQINPPETRTLGVFVADSIKVKSSQIEIDGRRFTLERTSDTAIALSPAGETVRIRFKLNDAALTTVLAALKDALFFPSGEAAIAALPPRYRNYLPAPVTRDCCAKRPLATGNPSTCDCAEPCGSNGFVKGTQGLRPPQVIKADAPEITDEARSVHYNGEAEVGISVDESGMPQDFWITRSAGMGLDKSAANAVHTYRFQPATCHGRPLAVAIYIDVRFQISQ